MPANEAGKVVLLRGLDAGPGMSDLAIQTLDADGSVTASYYNQWAVTHRERMRRARFWQPG